MIFFPIVGLEINFLLIMLNPIVRSLLAILHSLNTTGEQNGISIKIRNGLSPMCVILN
jgi:hypothetical protein